MAVENCLLVPTGWPDLGLNRSVLVEAVVLAMLLGIRVQICEVSATRKEH